MQRVELLLENGESLELNDGFTIDHNMDEDLCSPNCIYVDRVAFAGYLLSDSRKEHPEYIWSQWEEDGRVVDIDRYPVTWRAYCNGVAFFGNNKRALIELLQKKFHPTKNYTLFRRPEGTTGKHSWKKLITTQVGPIRNYQYQDDNAYLCLTDRQYKMWQSMN